jgi:predicted peptidase
LKRISLTGVSSGGMGVWNLTSEYPAQWAAIRMAGPPEPSRAPAIKHIPCLRFHNQYDQDILTVRLAGAAADPLKMS